jgi:hypothetical protein
MVRCRLHSPPPPSSGSVGAAWFHPFSHSTTAPTWSCAAVPAPSPSELGRGTRWSPSAASRLARPRTPRLAARVTAADHRARAQAVLPQPSGSRFQTRWSLLLHLHRRRHATVLEPVSYPFRPRTGRNAPVSPIGLVIVKFAHAIARVLEGVEIWAERGATLGTGVTAPFVASLSAVGNGAPASLCRGGCDCGVVAAPSVP